MVWMSSAFKKKYCLFLCLFSFVFVVDVLVVVIVSIPSCMALLFQLACLGSTVPFIRSFPMENTWSKLAALSTLTPSANLYIPLWHLTVLYSTTGREGLCVFCVFMMRVSE